MADIGDGGNFQMGAGPKTSGGKKKKSGFPIGGDRRRTPTRTVSPFTDAPALKRLKYIRCANAQPFVRLAQPCYPR